MNRHLLYPQPSPAPEEETDDEEDARLEEYELNLMNKERELLPRTIYHTLRRNEVESRICCIKFNRTGNILALGHEDGVVSLLNYNTKTTITHLYQSENDRDNPQNDTFPVDIGFLYPQNGSTVVVAYKNGSIMVFDCLTRRPITSIFFPAQRYNIRNIVPHPKMSMIIVILENFPPLAVFISRGYYSITHDDIEEIEAEPPAMGIRPRIYRVSGTDFQSSVNETGERGFGNRVFGNITTNGPHDLGYLSTTFVEGIPINNSDEYIPCAAFLRDGRLLVGRNNDVSFRMYELELHNNDNVNNTTMSFNILNTFHVPGDFQGYVEIRVFRKGVILVPDSPSFFCCPVASFITAPTVANRYEQKRVMRSQEFGGTVGGSFGCRFKEICLTYHGYFIIAALYRPMNKVACHDIYIFARTPFDGSLETGRKKVDQFYKSSTESNAGPSFNVKQIALVLRGAQERVWRMYIHPIHPEIVTIGNVSGKVYFWKKTFKEQWAKFIPRFTERDSNDNSKLNYSTEDLMNTSLLKPYEEAGFNADVDVVQRFCPGWYDDDSEDENEEEGREEDFFLPPVIPGGSVENSIRSRVCSEEFLRILACKGTVNNGTFQLP